MAQDSQRTMPVFGSLMAEGLILAYTGKIAIRLGAFYLVRGR